MKSSLLSLLVLGAAYFAAHGQANTRLSNLVAPTAVNADLLPNSTNTRNLGSNTLGWKSIYTTGRYYINGGLFLHNKGINNTFIGDSVGTAVTTGNSNTGMGDRALFRTTTGGYNTAIGRNALFSNTSGIDNTATGYQTLHSNIDGSYNTASGFNALYYNTSGSDNTAYGVDALLRNTTSKYNIAIGNYALRTNTTGGWNTAAGYKALYNNIDGNFNAAFGYTALTNNTTGDFNAAYGYISLTNNTTGSFNTALGYATNVASGNLVNATAIGANTIVDASHKVRIGHTTVTKIGGQVSWSTFSDGRYKRNIKQDVQGLDFINSLNPVTYTVDIEGLNAYYDKGRKLREEAVAANDVAILKEGGEKASNVVYNGFIAQEVEEAAKKLNYTFSGVDKPQSEEGLYGLRYSDFVVPLVKAVQQLDSQNKKLTEENKQVKQELSELRQMVLELKNINNNSGSNIIKAFLEGSTPNPASGTALIRYYIPQYSNTANIVFTDMKGAILKSITVSNRGNGQFTINTGAWTAGTYTYTLYINGFQTDSKKLVIAR